MYQLNTYYRLCQHTWKLFLDLYSHYDDLKKVKVNISICYWPLLETRCCSRGESLTSAAAVVSLYWRRIWKKCCTHHNAQKKPTVFLSPLIFPISFEIYTRQEYNVTLPQFYWLFFCVSELQMVSVSELSELQTLLGDAYNLCQREMLAHLSQWSYILVHKPPIKLLI